MTEHAPPPQLVLLQMIMGSWVAQALGAVARLGVADQLGSGPKSSAELAEAVGAHTASLRRTLRALAGVGVFRAAEKDSWVLTPLGECLKSDVTGSMRYMAIAETDHGHWAGWERFTEAVRTGKPQAEVALGCPPWKYYEQHPEDAAAFSRAMANISSMSIEPVLGSYDFAGQATIADVGGAYGALLAAILRKQPAARGILFDLPHIVADAVEVLGEVSSRVERIGGDFLGGSLPAANLYLLKHILHDWDDSACVRILKGVREAMPTGARLLVIELLIPEDGEPSPAALMDLNMMVMLGGMERTAGQYAALFEQAGLKLNRTIATHSPYSILEGVTA